MSIFEIREAKPINNRLLIALAGPQASGKTTSALRLATGITRATGGKICFIDTEKKRALTYASAFTFNHLELDPPFSPERYDQAIQFAEKNGYGEGDVLIIDSMSHEHEGPGGVLEMHADYMKSKNYNQKFNMLGWNHAKKGRKRLISSTLQRTPCHIILCFRAKQGLKEAQVNGKTQYVNTGLEPIGADDYFYEMNISMILPLGAMGKPDWNENLSRINEYGEKLPITDLLRRDTTQISEDTGYKLAQMSQVSNNVPPTDKTHIYDQEETLEDKTKRIGNAIAKKLKSCSDYDGLQSIMDDHKSELDEIESNSVVAHTYLYDLFYERQNELAQREELENDK